MGYRKLNKKDIKSINEHKTIYMKLYSENYGRMRYMPFENHEDYFKDEYGNYYDLEDILDCENGIFYKSIKNI